MPTARRPVALSTFASMAVVFTLQSAFAICLVAQSSPPAAREFTVELEDSLFILDPHLKNAKGAEIPGAIDVVWIPQPLQKYCLGRSFQECASIDFCNRTTTKSVKMCQDLPANLRHIPPYPAGMRPARMLSIVFFQQAPTINGFDTLRQSYDSARKGTLDRFSTHARIKARVRLTRTSTDDSFELLEILAVPSL